MDRRVTAGLDLLERYPHLTPSPTFGTKPKRLWWSDARREEFERMWRENADVGEIADRFEISEGYVYVKAAQWGLGRRRARGSGGGRRVGHKGPYFWTEDRIARLKVLWADPEASHNDIVEALGAKSRKAVNARAYLLKLPRRPREAPKSPNDRLRARGGGQRRFVGATGRKMRFRNLDPQHPAIVEGRSRYQARVKSASVAKHVLVEGKNSSKTGWRITKGPWAGKTIHTLTLEERRTCPSTCRQWLNCYGNNLHLALRLRHDEEDFAIHLSSELLRLNARYPEGFVVRLHILGDFFSVEYVNFWRDALDTLPGLHIWGYTARKNGTPIGSALFKLASERWDRFALRWSDLGSDFAAAEVVEEEADAKGIICPAEKDETRCCATCGLCWARKGDAPAVPIISFLRH